MSEQRLIDANNFDFMQQITTSAEVFLTIRKFLETAPTIDAVPVIHGHWFYTGAEDFSWLQYKCSNCRHENGNEEDYCPKCGAKMDEAAE